jgi:hypothetical protein
MVEMGCISSGRLPICAIGRLPCPSTGEVERHAALSVVNCNVKTKRRMACRN